ncbi:Spc98 family-domain-containing protein [Gaertneriomyces semiglobifer]|nr:Spc98 family-domain-containing protein [Gaertneriomyces semiglobifer]
MENTSVADTTALDGTTLAQTSRTGVSFSQDLNATEVGSARRHPLRDSPLKARDAPRPKSQTVDRRQHLGSLPYTEQERLVLQDLLYVLLGIDGIYIQRVVTDDMLREGKRTMGPHLFKLESTMDSSIAELVKRIVKLADNYEVIEKFIESHSKFAYGRVVHALTAKMRSLLRNYTLLVVQLEHQALTVPDFGLQKLWFYVHPSLTTMSALASLVEAIRSVEMKAPKGKDTGGIPHCRGGLLLGVISERLIAFSGDPVIKALHEELLSASAIPYNIMLANWINNGEIHDPFNEFLIEERKPEKEHRGDDFTGAYWEGRYFLREDYVPSFLMPYKHKIILAGKYLNVIKECEAEIPDVEKRMSERKLDTRQPIGDVILALGGERFVESIEGAYRWSNRTLLSLLFRDRQLTECLRSIKRFFLLDQSDFITHFLDVAHEHLLLASHDVPITRVRALFELVLRNPGSTAASSKDYENVTVDFSSYPLMDALAQLQKAEDPQRRKPSSVGAHQNGWYFLRRIEAFQLEYTVKFPNSIVIKRRFIAKYQMLFRHMFSFRYIERQLADAWRNQIKSRLYDKGSRFRKRPALFLEDGEEDVALRAQDEAEALVMAKLCALRHRMLHFVQQFMHHMCYEVIEPGWEAFERDNEKAATIEELIEFHERFQDHCFRGCLLSDTKLIEVLETIKGVCRAFTAFSHSYCRYKSPYSPDTEGGYASHPSALPNSASERFDDEFFASTDATSKLKEYENQFLQHIRKMIDALTGLGATKSANFTSLAQRIDYNLYYQRIPTDLSSIVQVPMDIPGGLNDVDHLNI